jgi:hypothetical protein
MVKPVAVEQARAIPVELHQAFDTTLTLPLTTLFCRRYGPLPPVREVRGQDGVWGREGQTRVVVTSDGGTMSERLTAVESPDSFSYRLCDITGPMGPLVDGIDGRWEFAPIGTGTLITWRWILHPTGVGARVVPLIARLWRGYARQALELLSDQLLTAEPPGGTPG